jgi:Uma2 family endonuclease
MTATLESASALRLGEDALSDYERERGKPMPSKNHGLIQANLIVALSQSSDFRPSSEMTLDIGMDHPVTPDISMIPRTEEIDLWGDEIRYPRPPVSVVEIVSPSQTDAEMIRKVHQYLAHGVQTCWLVLPSLHQIIIYRADGTRKIFDEGLATDPVTGVSADLARVFS